jgi:hypothetical protein
MFAPYLERRNFTHRAMSQDSSLAPEKGTDPDSKW